MGFETGKSAKNLVTIFREKQWVNAYTDSQGWAEKSERTFDFEIPFLIFLAVLAPERAIFYSRFWVSVGSYRSVQAVASVFRGLRAPKTHAKSSLGRPEAPVLEDLTRVSVPSPSSTRAVLASFPGAREENERQRRR